MMMMMMTKRNFVKQNAYKKEKKRRMKKRDYLIETDKKKEKNVRTRCRSEKWNFTVIRNVFFILCNQITICNETEQREHRIPPIF